MKPWFIFILLLFTFVSARAADRKITLDSLSVHNNQLCISYHIDGLLNNKTIQGLEKGLTSEVFHQIRLWKSKKLFSSILVEKNIIIQVLYDNWEDKFRVITTGENRLTTQVQTVRDMCALVHNHELIDLGEIDSDSRYYISVQTVLKPVSAETYHELSDWLSGQSPMEDKEKPKKNGQNKVFSMFLNMLGFGETVLNYKSNSFQLDSTGTVIFVE